MKKETRGGKRKGAGRPKLKKSEKKEPTKVIRVPVSKLGIISEVMNSKITPVKTFKNPRRTCPNPDPECGCTDVCAQKYK